MKMTPTDQKRNHGHMTKLHTTAPPLEAF